MDNQKNDVYYLKKIYEDLSFMVLHTKALSEQTFNEDQILIDAMMFRFIQISEYIKRVSETFKSKHTDIPWMSINGLRNKSCT